jgi:hypothetical protein
MKANQQHQRYQKQKQQDNDNEPERKRPAFNPVEDNTTAKIHKVSLSPNQQNNDKNSSSSSSKKKKNNAHITSLSNDVLGKIFQYLKFVDGPLKMTETCRHFAKTLDTQFLVQSSSGIGKVLLRKALLANNKEIETILRDDLRVEDDVLNCGHCDHTDRAIVRRCNAPPRHRGEDDDRSDEYYEQTRYECKRMMYICKECTISSDVYCAICDTYGT